MAAILRVKRRNDDEPLEALVLGCKRRKTGEKDEEETSIPAPVTAVLKFAGTVKNQDDNVVEHIVKTLGKDELKSSYKQHTVNLLDKARKTAKQASAENRYKVVNCLRSLDTSKVEELEDKTMTLIDVEDSFSCSNKTQPSKEEDQSYVYDLYYAETTDNMCIDDSVYVHGLEQELVFDSYRTGFSEHEWESEDSNSESNWRNDYPDSDHSERSTDENEMREAVKNMRIDSEAESTSEDDFVYAVDEQDVNHFGYNYAKYKARIKTAMGDEDDSSECSSVESNEADDESDEN